MILDPRQSFPDANNKDDALEAAWLRGGEGHMGHSFIPETCSTLPGAQMQVCGGGVGGSRPLP